jgi:formate/nitrite transporter FocA (FNT family)
MISPVSRSGASIHVCAASTLLGSTARHGPIVPPVAAFVAAGFEHSIANLYLLPYGLAVKSWAGPEFWAAIGQGAAAYPELTVSGALHNIVVAT